jgi:NADH:ubiquinone oxidoreductase subunit 5 (subunit L)/multisubunit Na+/H+ antiporter MnhA subunit
MAGIFAAFNGDIRLGMPIIGVFIAAILFLAAISRPESDAKRVVATSTVIMVGLIWILLVRSLSCTSVLVCVIHAAYKSALFLGFGRLLAQYSNYLDNFGVQVNAKSTLILATLFLLGLKSSSYSAIKHGNDIVITALSFDLALTIFIGFGLLVY